MSKYVQITEYIKHFIKAKRGGHGIHSPFVYDLSENVFYNKNSFYEFEHLQSIRNELEQNQSVIEINDLGAGSLILKDKKRSIQSIAKYGISSKKKAEFLFRLVNYLNCKNIIELGTSLGLTSLYLARAGKGVNLYTIEGDKNMHTLACELFKKNNVKNIKAICADFDTALPKLLNEIGDLSMLYIDGNHRKKTTIQYAHWAMEKSDNQTVIVLDDIYWNKEMKEAWNEIYLNKKVKLSIDCYHFGLLFFRDENKEKEHFRIWL